MGEISGQKRADPSKNGVKLDPEKRQREGGERGFARKEDLVRKAGKVW